MKKAIKKTLKKTMAARTLVESLPSSKALSREEKRAAAQVIARSKDGDLPEMTAPEAEKIAAQPHVRDVIVEALVKIGVTPDKLARCLADGLDATETKFFQHEGRVMDQRDVRDWGARHAYLETALKVVGGVGKGQDAPPPSANVFVFRSFLGAKPVEVQVGAPEGEVVKRRLRAAKVSNRSYA